MATRSILSGTWLLVLVGCFSTTGCATRARDTATQTGCSASEVIVWDETSDDSGREHWNASCGREQFRCTRHVADPTKVACVPSAAGEKLSAK